MPDRIFEHYGRDNVNLPHTRDTQRGLNMSTPAQTIKQAARQLIDQLPENATWNDVVYEMVVRQEIEKGLEDSKAGRTTPVEEVMKEFGVDE